MNNDVKQAYEKCGELKAKVACLEKEKEHGYCHTLITKLFYFRFNRVKNLAASLPSNLLPTRDTKEYRQAFEYKNHTVFDEDEDEMIDGNFYAY